MSDLDYIVRPSKIYKENAPAIFMFHGYGSNKEDLFSFAEHLSDEFTIVSLQAPYGLSGLGYAWYAIDLQNGFYYDKKQAQKSLSLIEQTVKKIIAELLINPLRVTFLGFSQGCILSLALAFTYPNLVQRVVGLSGFLQKELLKDKTNYKNDLLKIYLSHGVSDPIIPIHWVRESVKFLKENSVDVHYQEFNQGHFVSSLNFQSLYQWIIENC